MFAPLKISQVFLTCASNVGKNLPELRWGMGMMRVIRDRLYDKLAASDNAACSCLKRHRQGKIVKMGCLVCVFHLQKVLFEWHAVSELRTSEGDDYCRRVSLTLKFGSVST